MHVTPLLSQNRIRVGVSAPDKQTVISLLLDLVGTSGMVQDAKEVERVVLQREAVMSTAVGKGLALPHGKTGALSESVAALVITESPVDFEAFDGEPVQILFMLVGPPDAHTRHIRTLSRISRIMSRDDVRAAVVAAGTAASVLQIIGQAERDLLEAERAA